MAQAKAVITHGRKERLNAVAGLNGRVFDNDPVLAYMMLNLSREKRLQYLPEYWTMLVKAALLNDAIITEADDWKAAAVLIPPGRRIDNIWTLLSAGILNVLWRVGWSGCKRMLIEFCRLTGTAKKKGLHGQKQYYYLFSIGTEKKYQKKGLARAIIEDYQRIAEAKNLPIWLEATTANSRKLYLSMGFEDVEEIFLGKNMVAPDASLRLGGSGVPLWGMVWWPRSAR